MALPEFDAPFRQAPDRAAHAASEAAAAGIYGVVVSAAVMAASHAPTTAGTVVVVLVTLTVYWAAERYSRIIAERLYQGQRPSWQTIRRQLTEGWQMVTASAVPLAVLVLTRLLGADLRTATIWALVCSTAMLCSVGWGIGRGGRLTVPERLVASAVAGLFGAAMIVLKAALH